jgi:hypothetical protein
MTILLLLVGHAALVVGVAVCLEAGLRARGPR